MMNKQKKIYSLRRELPKLTEKGFEKVKIPSEIWGLLKEMYLVLRQLPPEKEADTSMLTESIVYPMWNLDSVARIIHNKLIPIFEWWCKESLEPTSLYGLRSYFNGAKLYNHYDWVNTHHVSCIVVLDKDLNGKEDWPLQFHDHDGHWNDVYLEPGEMLLYESAICEHGREEIFKGNYYTNCYFHSRLKNWKFLPTDKSDPFNSDFED